MALPDTLALPVEEGLAPRDRELVPDADTVLLALLVLEAVALPVGVPLPEEVGVPL